MGMGEAPKGEKRDGIDGQEQFDLLWRPLIGMLVVVGFGAQAVLPFASPLTVLALVVGMGLTYHTAYANFVSNQKPTRGGELFALSVFFLVMFTAFAALTQVVSTMNELEEPCTKLRVRLLRKADSEAADTYTALRCPAFFELKYAPWKK